MVERCEHGQLSKEKKEGMPENAREDSLYVCMLCYDFGFSGGMGLQLLSMLLSFINEATYYGLRWDCSVGFPLNDA